MTLYGNYCIGCFVKLRQHPVVLKVKRFSIIWKFNETVISFALILDVRLVIANSYPRHTPGIIIIIKFSTSHLHQVFSISHGFSRFFRSYFILPNFWSLRNLIKQLFHSRMLDMRLVMPTLRYAPRWLFTIWYPTRARGIIVNCF